MTPQPSSEGLADAGIRARADAHPLDKPQLPGYELHQKLGEGGMGVVWGGVQLSTKRQVAIKFLSAAKFGSSRAKARFTREVELAASLQHPNIARVYDSGLQQNVWFYAMELIDGLPLDEFVRQNRCSLLEILALMEKVCLALQHAHQRGVIHRDLKPSNILVSTDSEPHILDFGLAKDLAHDASIEVTQQGDVSGTPAYISPEQAAGGTSQVDTRSDVYSLGVMLYSLLTRKPPHDLTGTQVSVIRRIAEEEVIPPRLAMPALDRDLEAILLKALAKRPEERYVTAAELAADLRHYQDGEPISARQATLWYFLSKRLRKHWLPVTSAAGVLLMLLVMAAASYTRVTLARREAERAAQAAKESEAKATTALDTLQKNQQALVHAADKERAARAELEANQQALIQAKQTAEQQKIEAQNRLIEARIAQAGNDSLAGDGRSAHQLLDETYALCNELGLDADPVKLRWLDVESRNGSPLLSIPCTDVPFAVQPGEHQFYCFSGSQIRVLDVLNGLFSDSHLPPAEHAIGCAALSPTGRLIAAGCEDGYVVIWQVSPPKIVASLPAHQGAVLCVAFSPDEQLIATGGEDHAAKIVSIASSREILTFRQHQSIVRSILFSKDGGTVVSAGGTSQFNDHNLHFWDPATGKEKMSIQRTDAAVQKLVLSPNGVDLGSVDAMGHVAVTDMRTGKAETDARLSVSSQSLAWEPDGKSLHADMESGRTAVVNFTSGRLSRPFWGHDGSSSASGFTPKSRYFWSRGDSDHLLQFWSTHLPAPLRIINHGSRHQFSLEFSPNATLLADAVGNNLVQVLDVATAKRLAVIDNTPKKPMAADDDRFGNAVFDAEGHHLIIWNGTGSIAQWDFASSDPPQIFRSNSKDWSDFMAISASGRFVGAPLQSGALCIWDLSRGTQQTIEGAVTNSTNLIHFNADNATLAFIDQRGVHRFDMEQGRAVQEIPLISRADHNGQEVFFDEQHLVVGDSGGFGLYDAATGASIWRNNDVAVKYVTFSADRRLIVTTGPDHLLSFWNSQNGKKVQTLGSLAEQGAIDVVTCSPRGQRFAAGVRAGFCLADMDEFATRRSLEAKAAEARTKLAASQDDGPSYVALGNYFASRDTWAWAIECMERARKLGTHVSPLALARCYWQDGRLDQADKEFSQAIADKEEDEFYLCLCQNAVRAELQNQKAVPAEFSK